jgi:hypothetical protein
LCKDKLAPPNGMVVGSDLYYIASKFSSFSSFFGTTGQCYFKKIGEYSIAASFKHQYPVYSIVVVGLVLRIAINLSVCEQIHTITATIEMYKDFNTRLTKLQERAGLSNPRNKLKKLLQDIDNLEKFYTDKVYRNKLESTATYPSLEYVQLENILEQDKKVKEKLNLLTEQLVFKVMSIYLRI